jgi:hypothetical protein
LEWANECICNSGKPNFNSIEFIVKNSKIEIICGKCLGTICWWPISTEQVVPVVARGTKKSSAAITVEID